MYFKLFYAVIANCDVRSYTVMTVTLGLLSAKCSIVTNLLRPFHRNAIIPITLTYSMTIFALNK